MPYDMCMCDGGKCLLKQNCLRFTGVAFGRFDSFGSPPFDKKTQTCQHFYSDKPKENAIKLRAYQIWLNKGRVLNTEAENWEQAEKELIDEIRGRYF